VPPQTVSHSTAGAGLLSKCGQGPRVPWSRSKPLSAAAFSRRVRAEEGSATYGSRPDSMSRRSRRISAWSSSTVGSHVT
jgi:hypothetical protein